jgi:hypothetical protein
MRLKSAKLKANTNQTALSLRKNPKVISLFTIMEFFKMTLKKWLEISLYQLILDVKVNFFLMSAIENTTL